MIRQGNLDDELISLQPSNAKICDPPRPSPDTPIIIYLPYNLPNRGHKQPSYNALKTLALSAHATLVEIGYRLSAKDPYPKPIHDVLAGYDWIRKHLSSNPQNHNDPQWALTGKKFGVCGELAGGSVAAMLALTECTPTGITAAALGNPIVDWTSPLENPISTNPNSLLNRNLISLHTSSFTKPEHRYDPFASPLLFFRTPAFELPPPPSLYGIPSSPDPSNPPADTEDPSQLIPRRRAHRKYPPSDSGLRLPSTRILVGHDFLMKEQVMEFAELVQRSVNLHEEKSERTVGERVEIVETEGMGLWGEKEVMEVGGWMGERLRGR
ncbi:MAG: hypothetical protein Q9182_001975 [Xanthomendoza sp. 2 TL-2023]